MVPRTGHGAAAVRNDCSRCPVGDGQDELFGCGIALPRPDAGQLARSSLPDAHFFTVSAKNSYNAFVAGSSGNPRSSLSFVCSVSLAPNTRPGTPASFNTAPRRNACAEVSG